MTIGLAITRTLIQRHRMGIGIVVGYALLACVVLLAIGASNISASFAGMLFSGLFIGSFYLLTVFMHSDSDVATPGSTYPNYYFTLPVKSIELAAWPVAAGVAFIGGLTFLVSLLIRQSGYDLDPLAAMLIAVTVLTTFQAVFWYPVGIAYSKLVLSILAVTAIVLIAMSKAAFGFSEPTRLLCFSTLFLFSVLVTCRGVAKARAGDMAAPNIGEVQISLKRRAKTLQFRSPRKAQFWYEWRQQGKTLPILSIVLFLLFLTPLYTNDTISPVIGLQNRDGLWAAFPTYLMAYFPAMLVLMTVYGWAVGCGAKRTDLKRGDRTFHLFFGTRPMRDEDMVWTKLKVAALSTLTAWGLFALASLPLLLLTGGLSSNGQLPSPMPIFMVLSECLDGPALLRLSFALLALVFLTWRNYVIGFWAELSGSLLLRYAQPVAAIAMGLIIAPFAVNGSKWFVVFLAAGILVKFGVSMWLSVRQEKAGLLSRRSLWRVWIGYLSVVLLFEYGALLLIRESRWPDEEIARWTTASALLLVMWLVPLTRILGAVGALSANRHR